MDGILIFDGDCGFCATCVRLARWLPADPTFVTWQDADLAALGVDVAQARRAVQWVAADGRVEGGARAVAGLLRACDQRRWRMLGAAISTPPFSWLAAGVYRLVARYRYRLPGGTPACAAHDAPPLD
jgi:predicted DCC family thiol-disulfide oxidoreductase YuxK